MKRGERKKMQVENKWHQVIETDPLAAGERFFDQFWSEANRAIDALPNRADTETMLKKLKEAAGFYRRAYSFSKDLTEATERRVYFREWKFHRLMSESARDAWCRVDSRNLPSLPYPKEAEDVLARLRAIRGHEKAPTVPVEEYQSRTGRRFV